MPITTMSMRKRMVTSDHRPQVRLSGGTGFSLIESLVALLIVVLITMGVATGVGFAQRQFGISMTTSESKMLYSTLENAIRNEICYAEIVQYDGEEVRFTSLNYSSEDGEDALWALGAVGENGNLSQDGRGEIALYRHSPSGGIISERILASTSYTRGMSASISTSADATDNHMVSVSLVIYDGYGNEVISEDFGVKTLNTQVAIL